jgi:hypothetical protein
MKRVIDYQGIYSPGKEDNINEFAAFDRWCAEAYERNPDSIAIEIGSYHGFSTCLIAQYFTVIALDLWGIEDLHFNGDNDKNLTNAGISDSWRSFIENVKQRGLLGKEIRPTVTSSDYLDLFPSLQAEFIFIDGNHDDPYTYEDAVSCDRHLSDTGIMAFHDHEREGWGYPYADGRPMDRMQFDPWKGVSIAVKRMIDEYGYEIYEKVDGMCALKRAAAKKTSPKRKKNVKE